MKILFLAGNINQIGGIEKYNKTLLSSLRETGTEVVLVERNTGGFISKISFVLKVIVFSLFTRPNYVICAHLHFSPICLYLKKFFGLPYSVSVYGVEVANIKRQIYKEALREADVIIYLFSATAEDVIRQIPETKNKMFNLPNSVDGTKFKIKGKSKELLTKYRLSSSAIVLTIGRMPKLGGDDKGYRRVIMAMPAVVRAVPSAKYLLVGNGDDVPGVRQLIAELHLEKIVILADAPTNEELVDYYNLGDVFILPSKNEGFPAIVLLEALACGIPVIGGNQRGAENAMLNGELGVIVPADSVSDISEAIIKMLKKNGNQRLFVKESLRAKALNVYGIESYKKQIRNFLETIK